MTVVAEAQDSPSGRAVNAAICVDPEAFDRFGRVLRHLLVGLVDQAINVRLVSSDPRVEELKLGPVQTILHERPAWPLAGRRIDHLVEALAHPAPTIVHAMSHGTYRVAAAATEAFDADLIVQITSMADCTALTTVAAQRVARHAVFSESMAALLSEQLDISPERMTLIRPGMLTSRKLACFADPARIPTLLCLSPLEPDAGADRLIEACHVLRRREQSFMLFLLGEGRQESALRRLIRQRGLADRVTLAHPGGNISQALQGADVYVRPAEDQSFVDDGLQAMGAGLAIVTVPSPVCDYFLHERTAYVCETATAAALADGIESLLTDRERARAMASGAVEYVRANHTISGMAEETAELYRRLALARATFRIKE